MKSLKVRRDKRTLVWGMIILFSALQWSLGSCALAHQEAEENGDSKIKEAIVKIYTVYSQPDYFNPWRMLGARRTTGSGCIIRGNKILTNAHVVANHTFIQVRRYGEAKRYQAEVVNVSHDADLAILTVKDATFFQDVTPLEFGDLPETQQEVLVYGFPLGGNSLSITKGVLSRIENNFYIHSSHSLLAGQIDAAINPGSSGGPVLVERKIVGVVMQTLKASSAENIGYMVPIPVIQHFFQDIEDGRYDGFPDLGILGQKMENPDMKRKYGLNDTQTGMLINHIFPDSPAKGKMQPEDILLAIDGHAVADDSTVEFRPKERTRFSYYIDIHQIGEKISLDVLREGAIKTLELSLDRTKEEYHLVPTEQYEQLPRYFIYGGIVFTQLTKNLIRQFGSNWPTSAPSNLLEELSNWVTDERQDVVVALKILAADVNQGYHELFGWVVAEVNDTKVKNFQQFFQLVTQSQDPYLVFKDKDNFELVIDRQKAEQSHATILRTYRIDQDRSPDLRGPQ